MATKSKYSQEDLDKYSGEKYYQRQSFRNFDEVSINGEEGVFYRTQYNPETKEWSRKELGEKLTVVFLRKRKRLAYFNPDDKQDWMRTDEVNTNTDRTTLRGGNITSMAATHEEHRKNFDKLKTHEVFYAILGKEIVKVVFKGTALGGSKDGIKNQTSFYEYLQEYGEKAKVWQYETILKPIEFKKGKRTLYSVTLSKGKKIDEANLERFVKPAIIDIGQYFEGLDAANGVETKKAKASPDLEDDEGEIEVIDVEDEEKSDHPFDE